jgi:hypothetical protein
LVLKKGEIKMYILKKFDKLKQYKFESKKEFLKLAFKNYEKDMKEKITKILMSETFNTSDEAGNNYTVVEEDDFDKIAEKLVKLFATYVVSDRRELLFAFIKEWKEEFKDENWDYLDFMAERFLGKQ